jgi:anti-sigma factor RsiW
VSAKPRDLSCQELVELVDAYLGDLLAHDERLAFDAHLTDCDACSTYLEQMKTVLVLANAVGKTPPPEEVAEPLLELFQRWRAKR